MGPLQLKVLAGLSAGVWASFVFGGGASLTLRALRATMRLQKVSGYAART